MLCSRLLRTGAVPPLAVPTFTQVLWPIYLHEPLMTDDGSIDQSRRKYVRGPLEREHLDVDPIVQFQHWFEEACEHIDVEPNAMALATVDSNGAPAVRTVLLKFFDRDGFVFFTNLESRKAAHIVGNHRVALLFWWPELERQIEINGVAERISGVEAANTS